MNPATRFIEARNLLLQHREDLGLAEREFRWPTFEEFNWARDYFDLMAAGNDSCAPRVVDDGGNDQALSFAQIAARSHQVAAFLAGLGVRSGDRLLLMLPNCMALWEVMLAAIRSVHSGKRQVPPEVAARVAEHLGEEHLTPRELDVLRLVQHGHRNKQIADERQPRTVLL